MGAGGGGRWGRGRNVTKIDDVASGFSPFLSDHASISTPLATYFVGLELSQRSDSWVEVETPPEKD